ncbi:MAG: hypothetical protein KKF44_03900 [Nanoarchaeota archaeon]|nr:hypothetical protein [Nanoarchaeota archaeon]
MKYKIYVMIFVVLLSSCASPMRPDLPPEVNDKCQQLFDQLTTIGDGILPEIPDPDVPPPKNPDEDIPGYYHISGSDGETYIMKIDLLMNHKGFFDICRAKNSADKCTDKCVMDVHKCEYNFGGEFSKSISYANGYWICYIRGPASTTASQPQDSNIVIT